MIEGRYLSAVATHSQTEPIKPTNSPTKQQANQHPLCRTAGLAHDTEKAYMRVLCVFAVNAFSFDFATLKIKIATVAPLRHPSAEKRVFFFCIP